MARYVKGVMDGKFYDLSEAFKSRGEFTFDEITSQSLDNSHALPSRQEDHTTCTSTDHIDKSNKLATFNDKNIIGKKHEFVSPTFELFQLWKETSYLL